MKRITAIILSVVMLFGVFSFSAGAATDNVDYNMAERFAFALNVVDASQYEPHSYITRAEFADLVYRLLNFSKLSDESGSWYEENFGKDTKDELQVLGDTKIFEDVDMAVPQYNAIKYMSENGLMNGMTTELFGPGYDITAAAVAKVMVNILGYEQMAVSKGGFPHGYMTVAANLKLLSGVNATANDFITARECLTVFYNALEVRMFDMEYITSGGDVVLTKGEDSFLTRGLGLVNVYGLVEDTGITTIYGSSVVGEKRAVIAGTGMYIGDCEEIRSLIGRRVDAYCKVEDNGNYTLVFAEPDDGDAISFSSSDFVSYRDGAIEYSDEDGKVRTANIASRNKLKVIYNGKALSTYTSAVFDFPYGDITLLSTAGGSYDLVVIRDYMVGKVNKTRADGLYVYCDTVYSSMSAVKYLQLDPKDAILNITNADGSSAAFETISAGDVLSVLMSSDGEYIEVIVSKAKLSGFVVDGISTQTSDITYISGESSYTLSGVSSGDRVPVVKSGKSYDLYLDHEGRLVWIEEIGESSHTEKAAFISGADYVNNGLSTDYKIRLYTEDGLMKIYDFDERIKLNGASRKTTEVFNQIEAARDAQKVILFEADDKAKIIKSIILPLEFGAADTDNRGWYHISPDGARLSRNVGETDANQTWKDNKDTYELKWNNNGFSFEKIMFFDKDAAKIINVPTSVEDYGDERDFAVTRGMIPFVQGNFYLVHGYSRDAKAMSPDVIAYANSERVAETPDSQSFVLVEKIAEGLNEDEEPVTFVTGWEVILTPHSCKKVSYIADDKTNFVQVASTTSETVKNIDPNNYNLAVDGPGRIDDLAPGDIIRVSVTADGELRSIFVNYDVDQNLRFSTYPNNPLEGNININVGYPLHISGTYIRMADMSILPENLVQDSANLLDPTKMYAHKVATRTILVVEQGVNKTTIRTGTIQDILSYDDCGSSNECDIIAGPLYGAVETIGTVVYKRTN